MRALFSWSRKYLKCDKKNWGIVVSDKYYVTFFVQHLLFSTRQNTVSIVASSLLSEQYSFTGRDSLAK